MVFLARESQIKRFKKSLMSFDKIIISRGHVVVAFMAQVLTRYYNIIQTLLFFRIFLVQEIKILVSHIL